MARRADAAGVDVVSVFHDLLYQPAIGPLLLMARVTERVRLGPAALNPFTLHPYEIAGQIALLDTVSRGRAYLGLVKGAWLDRLGIREPRPLAALHESVAIVRALLAGDDGGVAGERFTLVPGRRWRIPASGRPCRSSWDMGPGDGLLGGHGRRRGEDRREREPGPRPGRPRLDRQPERGRRARLRDGGRRGRRLGPRARALGGRAVPGDRCRPRSRRSTTPRLCRSTASASAGRPKRSLRGSRSSGRRVRTASSSGRPRAGRRGRVSS